MNQSHCEKFNNQVTTAKKTSKNRSFFDPAPTFSLVVDKRLNIKIFSAIATRLLHLSENVRVTDSSEPSGFLNRLAQWSVKNSLQTLRTMIFRRRQELRPKIVCSADRKLLCAYRKQCSDLTLNDLEPRWRRVKFPTFAVSPSGVRLG